MKLTFMIDTENFNTYCKQVPADWEITHLGNGPVVEEALIATKAEAILCDPMIRISASAIQGMPQLKIIQSFGVGFDQIDIDAADAANVYVCNNAGVNSAAVAEQTLLLILASLRKYHQGEAMVYAARQGEFKESCFKNGLTELSELKVGLFGFGAIGKETALRLAPFGCGIYYYDMFASPDPHPSHAEFASQEWIFSNCDIISLHMPVTPDTRNIINEKTLSMMKPGSIVVNTSRGELVDQTAVLAALKNNTLGFFAADTLFPEPVRPDNPILRAPEEIRNRMALSPHIGGITAGTFRRSYTKAFSNIRKVFHGERPDHIVNKL